MTRATVGAAVMVVMLTTGCTRNASDAKPTISAGVPPAVTVAAADFPSEWISEQVGGEASRTDRLSASQIADSEADLIVYVPGLDPEVDRAVDGLDPDRVVAITEDVSQIGRPDDLQVKDPYVWFDPVNVATMGGTLGRRMAQASALQFEANEYYGLRALKLQGEALQVDQRLQEQLNPCRIATLVAERPVLTYLARAYGLRQVPLDSWQPAQQPVDAVYYTADAQRRTDRVEAVAIDSLADGAPQSDLLQGILETGDTIAAHQRCPMVTPKSSDRPG